MLKTRTIPCFLVLVAGCSLAPEHRVCAPVTGSIAEVMMGPRRAVGTIAGGLAGAIALDIDSAWADLDGTQHMKAHQTIVTGRGDTLRTKEAGSITAVGTAFLIHNTVEPTSGTGRFASASGSITTEGELVPHSGARALSYTGEMCKFERIK